MRQDPNNYWEQLERLEKLIRASELKAGVVFSFHSLILGLFIDRLENFKDIFLGNAALMVLLSSWLISVLISIYFCFKCFQPQIEMKYKPNVFFFRNASRDFGSVEDYVKHLISICGSEQALYEQLAEQIHAESKIIDGKFKSVQKSIQFFALSFMFVILIIVTWLVFA
ncbi:DUF5706 domain-containing protein [Winogradskyella maritima]|uniref:Pycsar system effector family protein n=1 Tax=Winogradskyella maritima TaxID=1517766 RepID=A0ABV8AMM1_9FLAO|nr:DUF5706 domain-containing protein [Winogradskyella maritima]